MDCNMTSSLWDLEHLIMSNPSKTENDKRQPSTEWEYQKGEGIESMFPSFAGLNRVSSGSTTGFSTNSSSPIFKLASESSPGDSFSNIDFVQGKTSSTALEVSAESDLCLKLGKQTYSEDYWGRSNNEVSAVSTKLLAPCVVARKKSKAYGQSSMQVPRCQVDGCELDLSSAKDYHRKHRVCENHSKCPKITVGGLERRFCQQCSRLHAVSEFDEKKRSCRKRLSHHNARRRKPQGVFPLNPERDCNGRQYPNMLWNGLSLNTSSDEKYAAWSPTYYDTKPTQMESGFTLSFQRGCGPEEQLYAGSSRSFSAFQTSGGFSAGRSNSQLPGKGVGEYSGGLHESQDFYSALSLLSTSSDSHGTKHNPMVEPQPTHGTFPTHFI
ncbi:squamosa promoter-binding-like protein 10 isoform X2 [Raphanus sativus]|uniref:Squamosa promoter-binding-like protein 10 isoform X2 n=1 Tax=Raphanus sativus TaxID=3726 RepID=A0A6J0JSV7_RAPSA|nr:squamosa promoter-binding-like protein 10 isoform X2 [Raphanus sativus]